MDPLPAQKPPMDTLEGLDPAELLRQGAAASTLELRRFAATRLAPFKVPRRIEFVDKIPRTSTGKPQRSLLAERYRNRSQLATLMLDRPPRENT